MVLTPENAEKYWAADARYPFLLDLTHAITRDLGHGIQFKLTQADSGLHALHAGLGHAQVGVVGQGLGDQLVELLIAVGFPPLAVQRHAVRRNGLGRQAGLLRSNRLGLRKDAREVGTRAQRRNGHRAERKTAPAQYRGCEGVGVLHGVLSGQ